MKKGLKKVLAAALALSMTTGIMGTSLVSADSTVEGTPADQQESVVVMQMGEPAALDPCYSGSNSEMMIFSHIFDTLLALVDNSPVPNVATSWEISDDHLTWTLTLRDDVYFSDGEQLTANDVKYTFDRAMDPANNCTGNYLYCIDGMKLESVDVVDDFTVELHTSEPCASIGGYLADICVLPQHYYEGLSQEEAAVKPLGSGAYTLESFDTANGVITLKRNHNWWKELAGESKGNIETIVWRTSSEESTRVAELISGGADIIDYVTSDFKDQVEASATYVSSKSARREFIGITFNNENEVLKDVNFRLALQYAVDVQTIIDTLRGGESERTGSFANEPNQNPDDVPYPYDTEKATELLEESGITDSDGDGFVEYNGEKVHLVLTATGHYTKDVEIMTAVASYLEAVGIECEVQTTEWSTFLSQVEAHAIPSDLWFMTSGGSPDVQGDLTDFLSTNSGNYGDWNNADYDAKYKELAGEFDEDKRLELAYELQDIMYNDPPIVFFDFMSNAYGVSDKVDFTPRVDGRIDLSDAIYK